MTDDTTLAHDAIAAALAGDWKQAIHLNTQILKTSKNNVEALNRLAYAYLQNGQFSHAKKEYEHILKLDPYNHIASKNLKRLSVVKRKNLEAAEGLRSPLMFLEDPGKTKIIECIHVAPAQVLSGLSAGQEVTLKPKNHCVEIRLPNQTYLAALPDDISFKLIRLIDAGNTYHTIIKSVDKNSVKVFIREMSRGKRFANQPSFIQPLAFMPYNRVGGGARDTMDMTPTGEDDSAAEEATEERQ